jgi:hypothetical protein
VLAGRLAEILKDKRSGRVVAAMFLDMAFCSPIYERLYAVGFRNVHEVNFGLTHTPDRAKANMRAYMWDRMKDWLLSGAIETDEKMATDLSGPGYHINRSNLLVLERAQRSSRGGFGPGFIIAARKDHDHPEDDVQDSQPKRCDHEQSQVAIRRRLGCKGNRAAEG